MGTLVLNCVHYVTAVLALLRNWLLRFQALSFAKTDNSTVVSDARKLKKLPLHLGILVLEDDISCTDIANVILWSAAMGVSFISIYDRNGAFKRSSTKLTAEIEKQKQLHSDLENVNSDVQVHTGLHKPNTKYKGSSAVDVFLLCLDDGRQSVVNMARSLCHQVACKEMKPEDITLSSIDQKFQETTGYLDPDMIIRFGQTESLLGFMPWHVRLTEILHIPSHVGINYKTFKQVLVSYGDTLQRFGR